MIKIKKAKKVYKLGGSTIKALDDVSIDIKKGEFLAIIGPSGSGKSTLLHTIGGLDTLDSGKILVNEDDIEKFSDKKLAKYRNKKIGFVFQSFNLQNRYTALENVELPLIFAKKEKTNRRTRAKKVLEKVGLSKRLDHKPTELSGGQQQRVCIARAIVNKPEIMLADEPTGNLDSKSGEKIIQILKDLKDDLGVTVIVVTHDDRIAKKADRVIRILDGKIIEEITNGKEKVEKFTD